MFHRQVLTSPWQWSNTTVGTRRTSVLEDTQHATGEGPELQTVNLKFTLLWAGWTRELQRSLPPKILQWSSIKLSTPGLQDKPWANCSLRRTLNCLRCWWVAVCRARVATKQKAEWWTRTAQMGGALSPNAVGQDSCHHLLTFEAPLQAQECDRKSFCWGRVHRGQNTLIKPLESTFYPSTLSSLCFVAPSLLLMSPLESH